MPYEPKPFFINSALDLFFLKILSLLILYYTCRCRESSTIYHRARPRVVKIHRQMKFSFFHKPAGVFILDSLQYTKIFVSFAARARDHRGTNGNFFFQSYHKFIFGKGKIILKQNNKKYSVCCARSRMFIFFVMTMNILFMLCC